VLLEALLVGVRVPEALDRAGDLGVDAVVVRQHAVGSVNRIVEVLLHAVDVLPKALVIEAVQVLLHMRCYLSDRFLDVFEVVIEIALARLAEQEQQLLRFGFLAAADEGHALERDDSYGNCYRANREQRESRSQRSHEHVTSLPSSMPSRLPRDYRVACISLIYVASKSAEDSAREK